jgi:hypothetical protein
MITQQRQELPGRGLLANSRRCVRRPATAEHGEPGEEPLQLGRQEPAAPLQRGPERLVPRAQVTLVANQQLEAALDLREHSLGGHLLDPRGGQFDRERNSFQPPAQLADRCRVRAGELEVRHRLLRPVNEQRHAIVLQEGVQAFGVRAFGVQAFAVRVWI